MSYTSNTDLLTLMPERTLLQLSADDPLAGVPEVAPERLFTADVLSRY